MKHIKRIESKKISARLRLNARQDKKRARKSQHQKLPKLPKLTLLKSLQEISNSDFVPKSKTRDKNNHLALARSACNMVVNLPLMIQDSQQISLKSLTQTTNHLDKSLSKIFLHNHFKTNLQTNLQNNLETHLDKNQYRAPPHLLKSSALEKYHLMTVANENLYNINHHIQNHHMIQNIDNFISKQQHAHRQLEAYHQTINPKQQNHNSPRADADYQTPDWWQGEVAKLKTDLQDVFDRKTENILTHYNGRESARENNALFIEKARRQAEKMLSIPEIDKF